MSSRLNLLLAHLETDEDESFLYFAIAKEYENLNEYSKAEFYQKLKNKDSQYVGLYYHLGKLYETIENNEHALETYSEGINVAKKIADFHSLSELMNAKQNLELELE